MGCLAVRKVGRHDFWGLARLQNERGEATSFDLLPTFLGEGHIFCGPQQTDQQGLCKVNLILSNQHQSVGLKLNYGFELQSVRNVGSRHQLT